MSSSILGVMREDVVRRGGIRPKEGFVIPKQFVDILPSAAAPKEDEDGESEGKEQRTNVEEMDKTGEELSVSAKSLKTTAQHERDSNTVIENPSEDRSSSIYSKSKENSLISRLRFRSVRVLKTLYNFCIGRDLNHINCQIVK